PPGTAARDYPPLRARHASRNLDPLHSVQFADRKSGKSRNQVRSETKGLRALRAVLSLLRLWPHLLAGLPYRPHPAKLAITPRITQRSGLSILYRYGFPGAALVLLTTARVERL